MTQTVSSTMTSWFKVSFLSTLALTTWCAIGTLASAATIWTTAGAGLWSDGGNWSAGIPTSTDDVQFNDDDAIGVTTTMDLGASTTIASYEILLNTTSGLFTTALGTSTLTMTDMTLIDSTNAADYIANLNVTGSGAAALNVTGTMIIANGRDAESAVTFDPGVDLNIGVSAGSRGDLEIVGISGNPFSDNIGSLTPGDTFNAYLDRLYVGRESPLAWGEGKELDATLDLSGVTSGVLDVAGDVLIGEGFGTAGKVTVSSAVDVKIGVDASTRGRLRIAAEDSKEADDATSHLTLGSGKFEGFLTELSVAYTTATSVYASATNDRSNGLLDLSNVTTGFIDVDGTFRIADIIPGNGFNAGGGDNGGDALPPFANGTVKLNAIPVSATDLVVGSSDNMGGSGLLELNGTTFSVSDSVTIDGDSMANQGVIEATINGSSSGLYLGSGASLTIGEGLIHLIFSGPGSGGSGEPYWGLRWDGDNVNDLTTFLNDGKLTIDDSAIGGIVGIFLFEGDTYVGVGPVPEPSSLLLLGLGMLGLARYGRRRTGRREA